MKVRAGVPEGGDAGEVDGGGHGGERDGCEEELQDAEAEAAGRPRHPGQVLHQHARRRLHRIRGRRHLQRVHHRPAREHLGPHCSLNTAHTQANACGGGLASARPSSGSVSAGRGVVLDTRRRWRGREEKRSSEAAPAAASGEARAATQPVRARVGSSPPTRPARAALLCGLCRCAWRTQIQ